MVLPILHISGFQEFPNEFQKTGVLDFGMDNVHQNVVVDVVKTALDVALYEPRHAGEFLFQGFERGMAAPSRTKAVGVLGKYRLIDGLQYHPQDLLHQFIRKRRYAEGAFFRTVFLWYLHTPGRFGGVRFIRQA